MVSLKSKYRTHTCGELSLSEAGRRVVLSGWVMRKRDHGGVVFVDLRDHYGVTQIVFGAGLQEAIQKVRLESVIMVTGEVTRRAPDLVNPKIKTGEIEVHALSLELLSASEVLPFQIAEDDHAPESLRLKYRFLELRRQWLHDKIVLRSEIISFIRERMRALGFREYQTPILTSSSPEGARDFLVPSRIHPGKFFALPQAPQQFKQLIMVAGFDRYFQIAPCFRDEDARADRCPGEFYQLDLEMSFVEQDQVFEVCETLFPELFSKFSSLRVSPAPFERIRYDDAMVWYGTDKPDLRIPHKMQDVTDVFCKTEFKVFRNVVDQGGRVSALKFELSEIPPRSFFDNTIDEFKVRSGHGLAYLIFEEADHKGSIAKYMAPPEIAALREKLQVGRGISVVFMAAGATKKILPEFGKLRVKLAKHFGQADLEQYQFCWVVDYPMYELDEATGRVQFSHNPFSMPQGGLQALLEKDPLEVYAYQYDLVCNGVELSSGAIRNHSPEIMYKAFEIGGYSRETVDEKFGGMIRAFRFGAPPHGGIAPGIDRIVWLLTQAESLREVIMFPMAQTVEDLMMGAPSYVTQKQLDEVHIQLKLPPEMVKGEGA